MHAPPSVTYPVGRSRMAGALLAGPWLAGCAALAAWLAEVPAATGRQAVAAGCLAAAGLTAWQAWRRMAGGDLAWTGEGWSWCRGQEELAGTVEVVLDLQAHLLLRWRGAAGGRAWLWLARASAPAHWQALRRAVYSRAGTGAPHGVL